MSFIPVPSTPIEPARVPGRSGRIVVAVWVVILVSVGVVFFYNARASHQQNREAAVRSFQTAVACRTGVGEVKALSRWHLMPAHLPAELLKQLRRVAQSPDEKLWVACVAGEVEGDKAALAELDRVTPESSGAELKQDAQTLRTIYENGPADLSADRRHALVEHQGWFGKLALSKGQPDSDPPRARILRRARDAFLATLAMEVAAGVGLIAGLVTLIVTVVLLATRSLRLAYRPNAPPTSIFIESFAIYVGGYVAIGLLVHWLLPDSIFIGTAIAIAWVPFALLWPRMRGASWAQLRQAFGWNTGRGVFTEMAAGVAGYITGLPIVLLATLLTFYLATRSGEKASHPIMFADTHGAWHIVRLFLLASVWAPVTEETLFRGALFHHLRQRHTWVLSAVVSAGVFASLHPQGWTVMPVLAAIGFVLAGIREWRGTTLASMTAHALHNGVLVAMLVLVS